MPEIICKYCGTKTPNKSVYNRHCETKKHAKNKADFEKKGKKFQSNTLIDHDKDVISKDEIYKKEIEEGNKRIQEQERQSREDRLYFDQKMKEWKEMADNFEQLVIEKFGEMPEYHNDCNGMFMVQSMMEGMEMGLNQQEMLYKVVSDYNNRIVECNQWDNY